MNKNHYYVSYDDSDGKHRLAFYRSNGDGTTETIIQPCGNRAILYKCMQAFIAGIKAYKANQ